MSANLPNPDGQMCCDCGPFYLDVVGRFPRERLRVEGSPLRRTGGGEVETIIENAWLSEVESARKEGRLLYDGKLLRLVEHRCEGGVLALTVGPTSFREFVGTNLTHAYLRHVHGPEALSDALGVSAAVRTADGFIVLGRRSQRVAAFAGRLHPIGGMLEPGPPDAPLTHPADAIGRELDEELGVAREEIVENVCIGMVRDRHIVQPELIFDVRVAADMSRLRRHRPAPRHDEHSELVPVRDHPTCVATFMQRSYGDLTPVAQAALLLHGLQQWGSGWFAATRGYLRSVV
jgi:hypothetical protein